MKNFKYFILYIILLGMHLQGCKKFLDVDVPPTAVSSTNVFSSDANAISAMLAIYSGMMEGGDGKFTSGEGSITYLTGLASDELHNHYTDPTRIEFYTNSLTSNNSTLYASLWADLYVTIYNCNALLEGVANSKEVSASVKTELTGEAKFLRSFCYFYLTNLYGSVPLVLGTDYEKNASVSKASQQEIYQQIINDVREAKEKLGADYLNGSNMPVAERARPNKFAASAFLARAYLYNKDYANAELEATEVINQSGLYSLPALNDAFLANSMETIWAMQPVIPRFNTFDGYRFILLNTPTRTSLSGAVLDAFEAGDDRKNTWVKSITPSSDTYYYPFKYKVRLLPTNTTPPTEYLMVFRLAEQYLIRAEARANSGNIPDAIEDINIIRQRARGAVSLDLPDPLPALGSGLNKEEALDAVYHERQVELFAEWGHRWFDLKRTDRANEILGAVKEGNWSSNDQLFPIPFSEIQKNPKLLPQNEGYN